MLVYIGTVILGMSEYRFWRATPKKVNMLSAAHSECNTPDNSKRVANTVEELPFEI